MPYKECENKRWLFTGITYNWHNILILFLSYNIYKKSMCLNDNRFHYLTSLSSVPSKNMVCNMRDRFVLFMSLAIRWSSLNLISKVWLEIKLFILLALCFIWNYIKSSHCLSEMICLYRTKRSWSVMHLYTLQLQLSKTNKFTWMALSDKMNTASFKRTRVTTYY